MLKLLAVLTMVVDHVGYIFFPEQEWMRAVGRLTMPIFGYAIARGFYYTRNPNNYIVRMGILAIVSQLPFVLLFNQYSELAIFGESYWLPVLNMVVPWTLALLILKLPPLYIAPIVVVLFYIPMDYTSLVILLPVVLYHFWFKEKRKVLAPLSAGLVLVLICLLSAPVQWWSLLAIPLIYLVERYDSKIKMNRWFFYLFYPVHMVALLGIVAMV